MKTWKQFALGLVAAGLIVAGAALTVPILRPSAEGAPSRPTVVAHKVGVQSATRSGLPVDAAQGPQRRLLARSGEALAATARPAPPRPRTEAVAGRRDLVQVVIGSPTPAGQRDDVRVLIGGLLRVPTRAVAPEPVPPPDGERAQRAGPTPARTAFGTPAVELPELLNRPQVARALRRMYPAELRRAPVGGTSVVRVRIGEDGRAGRRYIAATSGNLLLDRAAYNAAGMLRFAPARFEGGSVRSEVDVPIEFRLEADSLVANR